MEAPLNPRMISEAAGDCVDLFHRYLSQSQLLEPGPARALLEDQYGRFNIWTSNIGVFAPAHASMDYRLREATDIKDLVVRLLETLLGHIEAFCEISADNATPNNRACLEMAPLGGPESLPERLKEPLAAVAEDIGILHKLSYTIRKANAESHNANAATTFEITDADGNDIGQLFTDGFAAPLLRMKFPDASESIRARLASAMLLRRRRMLYNKSRYAARPTKIMPKPTAADFSNPPLELVETRLISKSMTEGFKPSQLLSTQSRVLSQAHTATTFDPEISQKAPTPSHVSTAKSIPLMQDDELDFPPIPKPVGDLELICPYCFLVLSGDEATDSRKWREHVKNDLDPYVCLFEVCDQPDVLYKHSQPWLKHMRHEHTLQWRCPAKSHKREVFQNRAEFEDHMRQRHRGTLSEKQLALLAERSLRANGPTFTSCPLCGLSETNDARMESHVAQHLRFLALKSLPWPDDLEDTASIDSSRKSKTRTTIAEFFEHEVTSISHEVLYDAPERPRDKSEPYEENSSVFEKSLGAIRTEEWGFLGDILLGHSNDNASLVIDPDPILEAFAERLEDSEGQYIYLLMYRSNINESLQWERTTRTEFPTISKDIFMLIQLTGLVHNPTKINVQVGSFGTTVQEALQAASFRGDQAMVQVLLDKDVHVNAQGGKYDNALQAASLGGREKIVHMLLQKGADINAEGYRYGTALQAASCHGHKTIVQMLLDKDADVNVQDGEYGNALQAASFGGHENIVQMLLDKDVDINVQGNRYGTALQAASCYGHKTIVQMLLDKDVDVNAQGGKFGNALQAASSHGHETIVQMLLDKNVNVNAQDGENGTALRAASSHGHRRMMRILRNTNIDINAQDRFLGNALQAASYNGHKEIVQMLLDKDIDVNAQDREYGTALQAASLRDHERIVRILLEREDVDVNAPDGEYGTALQAASLRDHERIVRILLEREDVDVNAQDGEYGTALQAASLRGHERIVRILLEREDVNVNAQNKEYGTALQAASLRGHEKIVRILLEREDVDVNAQNGESGNALQAADLMGYDKIAQMLRDRGASTGESVGVHDGDKEKSPGRRASGTLPSMANLASTHPSQGRSDKAKSSQTQVIKGHEKAWGSKMSRSLSTNRRRVDTESDTE